MSVISHREDLDWTIPKPHRSVRELLRAAACGLLLSGSTPSIAACSAECNAMDATGHGECGFGLGYARAVSAEDCFCWPVIGCECEGEDCGELFLSYAECAESVELE